MKKFLEVSLEKIKNPEKNLEKELARKIRRLKRSDSEFIENLEEELDKLAEVKEDVFYNTDYNLSQILNNDEQMLILSGKIKKAKQLFKARYNTNVE